MTTLDTLCPLHMRLDATGMILHVGPTLRKLRPDFKWAGAPMDEILQIIRPRSLRSLPDILAAHGRVLHFMMYDDPQTPLKGILVQDGDGYVMNLSFGTAVAEAVSSYNLTAADFPATDYTIELLFLLEAKSAAMDESRKLNTRLQGAMIAAEEQAFTDTLTGLKNRRAMDLVLDRLVRRGEVFALMHLDLDYFKSINDTYGHPAGDAVLQVVARILVEETRKDDTIARVGGDEFVLLFPDLEDRGRIATLARRIIDRLEQPVGWNGSSLRISGSAGTTMSSSYPIPQAEEMLDHADVALYASKNAGRGRHTFFSRDLLILDRSQPTGERGAAHPGC